MNVEAILHRAAQLGVADLDAFPNAVGTSFIPALLVREGLDELTAEIRKLREALEPKPGMSEKLPEPWADMTEALFRLPVSTRQWTTSELAKQLGFPMTDAVQRKQFGRMLSRFTGMTVSGKQLRKHRNREGLHWEIVAA